MAPFLLKCSNRGSRIHIKWRGQTSTIGWYIYLKFDFFIVKASISLPHHDMIYSNLLFSIVYKFLYLFPNPFFYKLSSIFWWNFLVVMMLLISTDATRNHTGHIFIIKRLKRFKFGLYICPLSTHPCPLMNTLCIHTLNHNCYCWNAILVYSWFYNLEWRRLRDFVFFGRGLWE